MLAHMAGIKVFGTGGLGALYLTLLTVLSDTNPGQVVFTVVGNHLWISQVRILTLGPHDVSNRYQRISLNWGVPQ